MCVTRGRSKGFTLIELLAVIAIIAILAGMLLAAIAKVIGNTHKTATIALIQGLELACSSYSTDWGAFPPDNLKDGSTVPTPEQANNSLFRALTTVVSWAGAPARGDDYAFDPRDLDTGDILNRDSLIVDSWGRPIMYDNNASEGSDFRSSHDAKVDEFDSPHTDCRSDVDFVSAGPDGEFGTDDDISNAKR
jgi:prepilin-type N-terminal cleavage/methylation domain-containing protein